MNLHLTNKSVLITGASAGIGRAIAEALAEEGCVIRLVARSGDKLQAAAAELKARYGSQVEVLAVDLRDDAAVCAVVERFGDSDILVNNAGDIPHGTLADIDGDRWRQAWDLKVMRYIDLTRAFYARMAARKSGVIANIIGIVGPEVVTSSYIAGAAGNAALDAFTRALGSSSPDDGIRVVGVHPGGILTERQAARWRQRAVDKFGDAERWPELTSHLPFGRLGKPEEIGRTVAFLVSDAAGYISGATVTVDGGYSKRFSPGHRAAS